MTPLKNLPLEVLEQFNDLYYFQSLDGSIQFTLPQSKEVLGYDLSNKKYSIEDWITLIHPDDVPQLQKFFETEVGKVTSHQAQYRIRNSIGTYNTYRSSMQSVHNGENEIIGYNCIDRKVTDQLELDSLFETTINSLDDGISIVNLEGKHLKVNPAMCAITGYSEKELLASEIPHVYWPEDELNDIGAAFASVQKGNSEPFYLNFKRKNGKKFPVIVTAGPVKNYRGEIVSFAATVKDISDLASKQKELEKNLRYQEIVSLLLDSAERAKSKTEFLKNSLDEIRSFWPETSPISLTIKYGEQFFISSSLQQKTLVYKKETAITSQMTIEFKIYAGKDWKIREDEHSFLTRFMTYLVNGVKRFRYIRELNESERRYRMLFDKMTHGVVYQDMNGQILSANQAAEQILGLSLDQMQGKKSIDPDWQSFDENGEPLPGEDHPAMITLKSKKPISNFIMSVYQSQQKKHVWTKVSSHPVFDADNLQVTGVFSTFEDITESFLSTKELTKNERKYRFLFENINDLICLHDSDGTYRDVSPSSYQILGFTPEEMTGTNPYDYFHPDDINRITEHHQNELSNRGNASALNYRIRRKDGSYIWFETISESYYDEESQEAKILTSSRDITAMQTLLEDQSNLLERLRISNEELKEFAYVASHDLQEPLRMISSFTQLLKSKLNGIEDSETEEYMEYVLANTQRLKSMIDDLLEYSRVNTTGHRKTRVDLAQVLQGVEEQLKSKIQDSDATIKYHKLPTVPGISSLIERVFINLIENAIKYRSDQKPEIIIRSEEEDYHWKIEIQDNGIGIDQRYERRVFQIFQRLHRKEDIPGTGIGLAVCKRIVEKHGGKIWYKKNENTTGTTFIFTLSKIDKTDETTSSES
jgi:PAS domain S-box-containing protein